MKPKIITKNFDHQRNIKLQAYDHPLVEDRSFWSIEEYVLHLIHLKAYETAAEISRGKSVLDWGCNMGYGMEILANTASSIAGLDLSERAVIAARRRLGAKATEIQFYKGTRCDFDDQAFDVVTSFQVIEHISDYDNYFGEILRVLRPGGLAIFTTPNALLRLAPRMRPWNQFHIHEFAPSELRELLITRFPSVIIHGLYATDQLYKIERDRVERARRGALAALHSRDIVKQIKAILKQWFPFVLRIRNLVSTPIMPPAEALPPSEFTRFSTANLYFRAEYLDAALDLMALCKKSY